MKEDDTILRLRKVYKRFGNQHVLKDVSLDIKKGEIFGLIGASGSGKTTLLNILTGNLLPDSGQILFEPKSVTKYANGQKFMEPLQLNPNLLKKTIGYSPQSPSVYDKLTCRENLDLFASLFNISPEIKKININILLGLVNLKEFEDKRAEALSGGMRKRLDLACALVHDPKIVLLDEPTSDLDIMLRNQMWDLIKKINEKGTTIIMSSHFLDEIETLCDRIAIIHNNTLAFIGSPRDLRLQKNRGLTIKLETATRDYTAISEKIKTEYPNSEIHMSQIMEIDIKNVTVPQATVQKITQIILQNNQEIVDFSYSKEGLSEVFKEITGHKIKNPDRLIDEHHKLKEKLKEERHKLAKQNAKNHKWKI